MEAKDLRIGNLVNYKIVDKLDSRKEWYEVSRIDIDDLRVLLAKHEMNKDYQPIQLTEEWLLKFGFAFTFELRKKCYLNLNYNTFFWFFKNGRVDARINGVEFSENHKNKNRLIYVHQLQNLCFALTGKELTLNN